MVKPASGGESRTKLIDYVRLLKQNGLYRALFFSEMVNNIGDWFHLVAILELAKQLSSSEGIVLAAVFFTRMIPIFLFFPIAGAVSDTFDRGRVMLISSFVTAAITLLFPLLTQPQHLAWLYVLLFTQFASIGFYIPARRAIAPALVSPEERPMQGTLDGLGWSLIGAIGASTGGFAVSSLGPTACFYIDAGTFVVAGLCAWFLIGKAGKGGPTMITKQNSALNAGLLPSESVGSDPVMHLPESISVVSHASSRSILHPRTHSSTVSGDLATVLSGDLASILCETCVPEECTMEDDLEAPLIPSSTGNEGKPKEASGSGRAGGCLEVLSKGMRDSSESLKMGWRFIWAKENRHIAAVSTIKGCIGLPWGTADVVMVGFANMASMQTLGDSAMTIGILYGMVGLGCFIGPLTYNAFTTSKPIPWMRGAVSGFGLNAVGLAVMGLAPNIWLVMLANFIRSVGNSVCWIYSTLILQYEVEGAMLGRISSMEVALVTLTQGSSNFFAGIVIDVLHLSKRETIFVVAIIAAVLCALWGIFLARKKDKFKA